MQLWGKEEMFWDMNMSLSRMDSKNPINNPLNLIGSECCDKCLTSCFEFRLKIEGCAIKDFKTDFNITQVCTAPRKDEVKITQPSQLLGRFCGNVKRILG